MAIVVGSPIPVEELGLGALESLLSAKQMSRPTYLAVTVFLFYEFFLTLDQEIEHIWKKPWNLTSALYIFVRYFGTLYNLVTTVLIPIRETDKICQFIFGSQAWAGFIIVWAVQVILQMRLYALYHGSKILLVFMVTFFVAEVGIVLWILISTSLFNNETIAEHLYITGYYHHDIELCVGYVTPQYDADIWIPPFVFEAILALLALWAGIKHSRQQSRSKSARFNRPRLVDSLVHGNVIYFVSPLVIFVLFLNHDASLKIQWLAQILLWASPVTISAGCRLILSIREAVSSRCPTSVSRRTMSTFSVNDGGEGSRIV